MTQHLSPQEFVESLDSTLATGRLDHLAACQTCRDEIEQLRLLMTDVEAAAPVPQPSPLFWDHFSDRVRQATSNVEPAARPAWWAQTWRPLAAFAGGLAVVVLAVVLRSGPGAPVPVDSATASVAMAEPDASNPDELASEMFVTIASALPWEDVEQVAMPRADTVDNLIEQLTPAEREQLARWLRAGIGTLE